MTGRRTAGDRVVDQELAQLGVARRRARTWAIVALIAVPVLSALAASDAIRPPENSTPLRPAIVLGGFAVGAVLLAVTQLVWWWRSRRLLAVAPGRGVLGSPRFRAVADFRRVPAFVACDVAWLAVFLHRLAAARRQPLPLVAPVLGGCWPRSVGSYRARPRWNAPRPLFLAMLVLEAVALVIALGVGWWHDRRQQGVGPSRRS